MAALHKAATETVDSGPSFLGDMKPDGVTEPAPAPATDPPASDPPPEDAPDGPPEISDAPANKKSTAKEIADWKNLKKEVVESRAAVQRHKEELETLRQQHATELAELKDKASTPADYDEIKQRAAEMEAELAAVRVEASQEYKDEILAPWTAIQERADELAGLYEIDVDAFKKALAEPDRAKRNKALGEMIAGMDELDRAEIRDMVRDTQTLIVKDQQIRHKASEAAKEIEGRRKERETVAQKEARTKYESGIKTTLATFKDTLPFVPIKEGDTADSFYAGLAKKSMDTAFNAADPDVQAAAVTAIHVMPRLVEQNRFLQAKLKEAQDAIAAYTQATPGLKPSGADPSSKADTPSGWHPGFGT